MLMSLLIGNEPISYPEFMKYATVVSSLFSSFPELEAVYRTGFA